MQPALTIAVRIFTAYVCFWSVALAQSPDRSDAPWQLGVALLSDGEHQRASQSLKTAHILQPSAATQTALMNALALIGDYDELLSLTLEPYAAERSRRLYRGEAFLRLQRHGDAHQLAEEMLDRNAADERAKRIEALAYEGLGDDRSADVSAGALIRRASRMVADAWLIRGRIALRTGDFRRTQDALARAREAGANAWAINAFEIDIALRAGDEVQAVEMLEARRRRFVAAFPDARPNDDWRAEALRATLLLMRDAPIAAQRALNGGARRLKTEPYGPVILAVADWRAGDIAQAEAGLTDYLTSAPDSWRALDIASAFFTAIGDFDQAMAVAKRLAALKPVLGVWRLVMVAEANGQYDAAYDALIDLVDSLSPSFRQRRALSGNALTGLASLFGAHFDGQALQSLSAFSEAVGKQSIDATQPVFDDLCKEDCPAPVAAVLFAQRLAMFVGAERGEHGLKEDLAALLVNFPASKAEFEGLSRLRALACALNETAETYPDEKGSGAERDANAAAQHCRDFTPVLAARLQLVSGKPEDAHNTLRVAWANDALAIEDARFFAELSRAIGDDETTLKLAQALAARFAEPELTGDFFALANAPREATAAYKRAVLAAAGSVSPALLNKYADAAWAAGQKSEAAAVIQEATRRQLGVDARGAGRARVSPEAKTSLMRSEPGAEPELSLFRAVAGPPNPIGAQRVLEANPSARHNQRAACFLGALEACGVVHRR